MSLIFESSAFERGAAIPKTFSADGEDISPPLRWARGPDGTRSYVILMEDPDAPDPSPFVHWSLYNIPAETTMLERGVPPAAEIPEPKGALQGKNDRGAIGYFGPKPPAKDPAHNYHFQIFALDKKLDVSVGATRTELINAMQGHVLSSGELVGTYQR